MDVEITRWITEFLLRQPIPDSALDALIGDDKIPLPLNDAHLKKTILLRTIDSEISNGVVSESTLDSLELMERLHRSATAATDDVRVLESMTEAYCAVAVECAAKYLAGRDGGSKEGKCKYFEAVKRIWRERMKKLGEGESRSVFVCDKLFALRDELEAALVDDVVCERLVERNTRNVALRLVRVWLRDEIRGLGPPFLVALARNENGNERQVREMSVYKAGDVVRNEAENKTLARNENGNERDVREMCVDRVGDVVRNEVENENEEDEPAFMDRLGACEPVESGDRRRSWNPVDASRVREIQKKTVSMREKRVTCFRRHRAPPKIADSEEENEQEPSSKYDTVPTPEVDKVKEALKTSSMDLQAVVKDPLPDALHLAENIMEEIAKKVLNQKTSADVQNGKNSDDAANPHADAVTKETAGKISISGASLENPSVDQTVLPARTMEGNAGNPLCSHQNGAPKPSLMERNNTARTVEWEDSIDDSPEGTTDNQNRFRLESSKRKLVSPLKKHESTKIAPRRKRRMWSVEEEDALKEGVQKFGEGNWKLILHAKRHIFGERTEVDLKDKWRNLRKYG